MFRSHMGPLRSFLKECSGPVLPCSSPQMKGVNLSCVRTCMVVAEERPRIALTQSFSKLFKDLGLPARAVSTTFGCRVNVAICLQVRWLGRAPKTDSFLIVAVPCCAGYIHFSFSEPLMFHFQFILESYEASIFKRYSLHKQGLVGK